jgi:hypothetical protein
VSFVVTTYRVGLSWLLVVHSRAKTYNFPFLSSRIPTHAAILRRLGSFSDRWSLAYDGLRLRCWGGRVGRNVALWHECDGSHEPALEDIFSTAGREVSRTMPPQPGKSTLKKSEHALSMGLTALALDSGALIITPPNPGLSPGSKCCRTGRWTADEHNLFLVLHRDLGRDWKAIWIACYAQSRSKQCSYIVATYHAT